MDVRFGFTKTFFDILGRLFEDPDFMCRRCLGNAQAVDGRPVVELQLANELLDVVYNFVYLVFVQVEVVGLPLLRYAALYGENLEGSCVLVKQFL